MSNIYFTGDIHGNFEPFVFYITVQKQLHDTTVFVAGDIGIGFYKLNYYLDTFKRLNKKLAKYNIQVYFIRGNHDNPIYFTENSPIDEYYSHIHFVKDYEIITIENHNILCIGGATSVDKIYRKENETWWAEEYVHYFDINKIVNIENVDIVVSHAAPMFVSPKYERISWMSDETDLYAKRDRNILSNVYFELYKQLKYWFHGHYHMHYETIVPNDNFNEHEKVLLSNGTVIDKNEYTEGCKFVCLDMLEGISGKIDLFKI